MEWLDSAMSTLSTTSHGLRWTFFTTFNVLSYTVHLAAWPLAALWNALHLVCAPVIHTVRFFFSPLIIILSYIPRLQPLFIYFFSAASIGLAAGVALTLTTTVTFSLLGLYDKPSTPMCPPSPSASHAQRPVKSRDDSRDDSRDESWPEAPGTLGPDDGDLDSLLAGISSLSESDYLNAMAGCRDVPNTKRKRRSAAGLGGGTGASRFSTILEEDDDSF